MANEAVLVFDTSIGIPMIVANATGIEQGAAVKLTDPFTVSLATATRDIFGGITAAEKIASDGVLTVPVYRTGIFKVFASGNIKLGSPLAIAGTPGFDNYFLDVSGNTTVQLSGNRIWGTALEDASGGETFLMELKSITLPIG